MSLILEVALRGAGMVLKRMNPELGQSFGAVRRHVSAKAQNRESAEQTEPPQSAADSGDGDDFDYLDFF